MKIFWMFVGVIHLCSIAFLATCLVRLYGHARRFKLKENHHTLIFGVITLYHVVLAYVVFIALFTVGTIAYFSLLK